MKRTLIFAAAMMLLAVAVMVLGLNLPGEHAAVLPDPLLMLTEDDTGAAFRQLRLGVQMALSESGGELHTEIVSPEQPSWTARNYRGALVYIGDAALRAQVLSRLDAAGLTAVVIGHWDEKHTAVIRDEASLGLRAAALAAGAQQAAIVGGSEEARRAAQMALGSRAVPLEALDLTNPSHALLALDEQAALRCCQQKQAEGWRCALYAVNPGETRVAQLEQGVAQALLIPSPYAAGYVAAAQALQSRTIACYPMPYNAVLPQTMYDAQNVKLIFPLAN